MPYVIFINLSYEPLKKGWQGLTNCGKNRNRVSIEAILHSVLPTFSPITAAEPPTRAPHGSFRTHGHDDSAILCMH